MFGRIKDLINRLYRCLTGTQFFGNRPVANDHTTGTVVGKNGKRVFYPDRSQRSRPCSAVKTKRRKNKSFLRFFPVAPR